MSVCHIWLGVARSKKRGRTRLRRGLGRGSHQALLFERLPDGLRTGLQEEHPLEHLGDSLDAPGGFFLLEFNNLVADRLGQFGPGGTIDFAPQALFAVQPIKAYPFGDGSHTDPHLLGDEFLGEPLFEL